MEKERGKHQETELSLRGNHNILKAQKVQLYLKHFKNISNDPYPSFYSVIPEPDKMACVVDSAGGVQTGDAAMIITFRFADDPDILPGTYHMFDAIFEVVPLGAPPCTCGIDPCEVEHDIGWGSMSWDPKIKVRYTYKYTDVSVTALIDGSIWPPCHLMFGVTFDPDSAEVDEDECIDVEVFGGSTMPNDIHELTVLDWGGADRFGTFVQDGNTGDNTDGVLTFCPGCCDAGEYDIVVQDECLDFGSVEVGTLHVTVNETTGINTYEHLTAVVDRFNLSQNYPNPFNPITEIKYALPKDCLVKLDVFNILGQQMATLVDEKQKAGYKTARWDASTFSSGIYFYRLKAGCFVETRKTIVLK